MNRLINEANKYLPKEKNVVSVDTKFITESSWSRILQHIEQTPSFAVISAYRGVDQKENDLNHKKLKADVRKMGYGFIEQDSGYSYTDPKSDEEGMVEEESLFIPNISYEDAMALGKKYDQESILFKDNERGFVLVYTTESEGHKIGDIDLNFEKKVGGKNITFDPSVLKIAFSALKRANKTQKGKPFAYKADFSDDESEDSFGENYTLVSLKEAIIPSRAEAMKTGYKTGKLATVTWKKLI